MAQQIIEAVVKYPKHAVNGHQPTSNACPMIVYYWEISR